MDTHRQRHTTAPWYNHSRKLSKSRSSILILLCCLCGCCWGNAAGLAAGSVATSQPPSWVVLSTKSNGGHTQRYPIVTTADTSSSTSSRTSSTRSGSTATSEISASGANSSASSFPSISATLTAPAQQTTAATRNTSRYRKQFQLCQAWIQRQRSLGISVLRSTFLPVGYPSSVPRNYLVYCRWSWIQDWSTSLRAVVATQRVLQGIGVGRTTATALSAVHAFLVRDAAGMVATLGLTSWASGKFAENVKPWRLTADILVDIGISLEVAAVQMPSVWFVPMLCLGNMCKAMCGVAAGATGGPIALYWASRSQTAIGGATDMDETVTGGSTPSTSTDISDISAKFGAQHTVTASLGLLGAGLFAKSVATAPLSVVWTLYMALTILHIYANMQCLQTIAFSHLNTARYNLVVDSFLAQWNKNSNTDQMEREPTTAVMTVSAKTTPVLPTPVEISTEEPLFFWNPFPQRRSKASSDRSTIPINMGVSFNEFVERSGKDPSTLLLEPSNDKSTLACSGSQLSSLPPHLYWIAIAASRTKGAKNSILVALSSSGASNSTAWSQAYFHAALLQHIMQVMRRTDSPNSISSAVKDRRQQNQSMTAMEIQVAETVARDEFPAAWSAFAQACYDAGWDLAKSTLENEGYAISTIAEEV